MVLPDKAVLRADSLPALCDLEGEMFWHHPAAALLQFAMVWRSISFGDHAAHLAEGYHQAHFCRPFCNWVLPGRLMVGTNPM